MKFEDGLLGSRFPRFASIGDALSVGPVRLPADQLAAEMVQIKACLSGLPFDALMLSPATASTLYLGQKLVEPRPLTHTELRDIAPAGNAKDLHEYFSSLCDSMAHVCAHPGEDGMVLVIDG
ncbi:hypothetical protein BH11MYX3_BH11MYX3_28270 [soil metagenome]